MAPPPPPPPPPAGGYSGGGYYSSNVGSNSSSSTQQRLGLGGSQQQQPSSESDDWFAAPAAPTPVAARPPHAASSVTMESRSVSGFYSMNAGCSSGSIYTGYGASNSYSESGSNAIGTSGGGGYYVGSTGYGSSTNNTMSGSIGGGGTSSNVRTTSAFGSNPNSGSTGRMSSHSGSFEMGSNSFEGPIGGAAAAGKTSPTAAPSAVAENPHVFDPNAAMAKKKEEQSNSNAMSLMEEDYDNEPPLLEELGVNFPHIYSKSRAVLFPIGKHAKSLEPGLIEKDADLAGPLAFALGLGGELLLSGKLHFGYVYGLGVSGCVAMTLLLNLLNRNGAVSAWTVVSILGYALLPVNLLAGVNVLIRIHKLGRSGMVLAVLTVMWCTAAGTRLFERGCGMRDQRFLVAYPAALLYSAFVMITIF